METDKIDIEKIKEENLRLEKLIQPAIDAYITTTGFIPQIGITVITDQTHCGTVTTGPIIKINALV